MNPKIYIFLFFILTASLTGFAQIPNIDSLRAVLPNSVADERLTVLNELSTYLREIEQQEAFDYALEAEKLAQSLSNKSGEAKAKENIGWIYYRRGKWQKTFDYSKDAYFLAIEGDDKETAARVMNSMGALYFEQQNYELSNEQFKKAYAISNEVGDLYTMIRSLNNIAFSFLRLNELDSAMFYVLKAINTNLQAGSPYLLSFSNRLVGNIYYQRNQLDSAEIIYEKAIENGKSQGLDNFTASVLNLLGKTYLENGKLENARRVLFEGLELSRQNDIYEELAKGNQYLAAYFAQIGDFKKAFEYQSQFVSLNDSLENIASRDRLSLMQGMFQDDLDQSELDLLVAQNETQATALASNQRTILLVSLSSLLVFVFLVWLFYLNRNIKKYNANLILQKQQIHKQNADLEAKSLQLGEINQTKNKLFSILGHDLKGPVGQVKSIVDLLIDGHLNQEEFDELIQNLKKDVDSVYFTLNNTLKWSVAQMEGFKLQKRNFNLSKLVNTTITLINPELKRKSLEIDNTSLLTDVEIYADRDLIEVVIRNILSNAVKFSKSGDVIKLSVELDNDMISWCVKDNGGGMKEEQINELLSSEYVISNSKLGTKMEKGSGLGLQICKEFTRMNGGELTIKSKVGDGTKVCVKIPASSKLISN
ncbi:signal transduction histidine kinase [Algoriphagus ratkowskyi]|uniref:histidine kinase n=1 Tax=Algoriphagus ratkowskyi TaxID=57028 RepID=A0A2W7SNW9_9BACT|nr:ATP-binding protein [Algoriphagus ratkowskyi]PZX52442.1 signal transduction histidine kinase [Algoriphagus ratkowskyi]TXD76210.1 tetratricopeptide repeat protein [Algoriphagus ratkowskyi]